MQLQRVCHDTLPWLISFSLDLMRFLTAAFACVIVTSVVPLRASDWKEAPKPTFPLAALERNSQGVVTLRVVVTAGGTVDHVAVAKSSGDRALDEAARAGVLKWKMKHGAIKPSDMTQGRDVIIDFREEAAVAARYSDGTVASFPQGDLAELWRSAPFPSYPLEARRLGEEGMVRLVVGIGAMGDVIKVDVSQTSGYKLLDEAAIQAVRRWKAHPRYAGKTVSFPVNFTIQRRRGAWLLR
jgi:TonB family protein